MPYSVPRGHPRRIHPGQHVCPLWSDQNRGVPSRPKTPIAVLWSRTPRWACRASSAAGGELHDLLVGRAVLPGHLLVADAADLGVHDGVGAPLVTGLALRITRVDLLR